MLDGVSLPPGMLLDLGLLLDVRVMTVTRSACDQVRPGSQLRPFLGKYSDRCPSHIQDRLRQHTSRAAALGKDTESATGPERL